MHAKKAGRQRGSPAPAVCEGMLFASSWSASHADDKKLAYAGRVEKQASSRHVLLSPSTTFGNVQVQYLLQVEWTRREEF